MDPNTATILRLELALHGLSQAQLSKAVGLSDSMVSMLLNGQRAASPRIIAKLFHAIHRPIYEAGGLVAASAEPALNAA